MVLNLCLWPWVFGFIIKLIRVGLVLDRLILRLHVGLDGPFLLTLRVWTSDVHGCL